MKASATKALCALAVVGSCFAVSACGGGDDGPTKAETTEQAQALCTSANAKVDKKGIDADTTNPVVFLAANESRVDVVEQMYAQMQKIDPASEDKAAWEKFISAQGTAVAAMKDFRTFSETKPTTGGGAVRAEFQGHVKKITDAGDAVSLAAVAYGIPKCTNGPYINSPGAVVVETAPGVKNFASSDLKVSFDYPASWREKSVKGESSKTSVAFGDDKSDCGIVTNKRPPPGGKADDSQQAVKYAKQQAASALKTADKYDLVSVAPEKGADVEGAGIVRRSTTGGVQQYGHIVFFFKNGKRYVIDCVTSDVKGSAKIDADQFKPLIASFSAIGHLPK